jgi:hypothetical protein
MVGCQGRLIAFLAVQVGVHPPPPNAVPFSKTDSQRAAYRSTLTLDSDSTAANHPKVAASMTLGTCTSGVVWIRLRGGMEIQAGTPAVCS